MLIKSFIRFIIIVAFSNVQAQQSGRYTSVNVEARTRSRDASGNPVYAEWKPFETRLVDNFTDFKPVSNYAVNKYGSDAARTYKATGFFRVEKINERWWVIDPSGHPGLHVAVNSVTIGKSQRNINALQKKYGNNDNWINQTHNEIVNLGFNGTGSWSDTKAIIKSNKISPKPLAYTINLDFMSGYGNKRGGTFQVPGHKGYPKDVIFVFDPGFRIYCDEAAKELLTYKNDPNLYGYFSDNEMPFNLQNLDGYLSLPNTDFGYQAAQEWIDKKGITKEQITDSIRAEFLGFAAEQYFSIVKKTIKKYDPNHMYLGTRLYSSEKNVPQFMNVAGKYVDVLSINYYGAWTPSQKNMQQWFQTSGRPFMITEFYTKGEDSKLGNISGAGWLVKTQEDRGKAYQNFCLGLLESKNCLGWHWFKYLDNDPTEPNAEPSNTDANKGIVDNDYNLYEPLTNKMKQLNDNRFALIKYLDQFSHDTIQGHLPHVLKMANGTVVKTVKQWTNERRPEIVKLLTDQMFGQSPARPAKMVFKVFDTDRKALGGIATRKQIKVLFDGTENGPSMDILMYLPNHVKQHVPLIIGYNFAGNQSVSKDKAIRITTSWMSAKTKGVINNHATDSTRGIAEAAWPLEMILKRGYGVATMYAGDVDPDYDDSFKNAIHALYPQLQNQGDNFSTMAAWAWGLSRAMDYFEIDKAIDSKKVIVYGTSRMGKAALWAGATDERFAMVISNESGAGGAKLFHHVGGENTERICKVFPHWFDKNFCTYAGKDTLLPFDQHMLLALIAPRPLYVASAKGSELTDSYGEFLSAKYAHPVYKLFKKEGLPVQEFPEVNHPVFGTIGYHNRTGKHDILPYDWEQFLHFADMHFKK